MSSPYVPLYPQTRQWLSYMGAKEVPSQSSPFSTIPFPQVFSPLQPVQIRTARSAARAITLFMEAAPRQEARIRQSVPVHPIRQEQTPSSPAKPVPVEVCQMVLSTGHKS